MAWFYQDDLHKKSLRIIKRLERDQPVMLLSPKNLPNATKEAMEFCFGNDMRMYVVDMPVHQNRGYIKVYTHTVMLRLSAPLE